MFLIPIEYHGLKYPPSIVTNIVEVSGHFDADPLKDRKNIPKDKKISLHTEYSAKTRKMTNVSEILKHSVVKKWGKFVADLWESGEWSKEFAHFILSIVEYYESSIEIIEIHPPLSRKYDWKNFIDNYQHFYEILQPRLPQAKILIENRNGFLLAGVEDFKILSDYIDSNKLDLKLIVDFPQLLNYEKAKKDKKKLLETMNKLKDFSHNVKAFHLWGKIGRRSHAGDIDDFFDYDNSLIEIFYSGLNEVFIKPDRKYYFIPEINFGSGKKNRNQCLENIVNQLKSCGFQFSDDITSNSVGCSAFGRKLLR